MNEYISICGRKHQHQSKSFPSVKRRGPAASLSGSSWNAWWTDSNSFSPAIKQWSGVGMHHSTMFAPFRSLHPWLWFRTVLSPASTAPAAGGYQSLSAESVSLEFISTVIDMSSAIVTRCTFHCSIWLLVWMLGGSRGSIRMGKRSRIFPLSAHLKRRFSASADTV